MKKLFLCALILSLFSCKKEQVDNKDGETDPVACTLKLYKEFNSLVGWQTITFYFTDINGHQQVKTNPSGYEVADVDFAKYVKVVATASNNLDPDIYCNWMLKKDGIVIDVQSTSNYLYENQ